MSVANKNLCVYANSILFYCLDLLLRFLEVHIVCYSLWLGEVQP
jgi:hypothetical protein